MISGVNLRKQALEHKNKAKEYFQAHDWANAVKEYRLVDSFSPEMDAEIAEHFKKAQLEWVKSLIGNDNKKALDLLKDLIYTRPKYTIPYYYLGLLNEKSNNYDNAQSYYEQFLKKDTGTEFHKEVADKIALWKSDRTHFKNGVQFMANGDFALAYDEFSNVKTINKKKAQNFLQKINSVLGNSVNNSSNDSKTSTVQDAGNDAELLKSLKTAIENRDIALLKNLIADDFTSIIGNKDNLIGYYKNFWFTFFTDLHFNYNNVKKMKISDTKLQVSFDYTLKGIYNGKDMSLYNKNFTFGTENSISGKMLFYIEKKDNKWQITN